MQYQFQKKSPKKKMCITISEQVLNHFTKDCDQKFVKYSNRIEYLISRYLNSLA